MKPECEAAVRAAAAADGRQVSDADLRAIETRLQQAAKQARREDPQAWATMGPTERLSRAVEIAHQMRAENMAAAHAAELQRIQINAHNDAVLDALPAGKKVRGMLARFFMGHGAFNGPTAETSLEANIRALQTKMATQFSGKVERALDDPALTLPIAQEMRGQASSNPEAKNAAKAVADAIEAARQRLERAGVPVAKLAHYMPQPWDWTRFVASDRETFVARMMERLDLDEFVHPDGRQMTPAEAEDAIRAGWLSIHTNGANKRAAGTPHPGGAGLAGKYAAPRQFHFKTAEGWLQTMREYGVSDSLGSILREHFARIGRDIAIAEREGPMAARDVLGRLERAHAADLAAADSARAKEKIEKDHSRFQRMFKTQLSGHSVGSATWAARLGAIRSVLSASKLGVLVSQQPSDYGIAATYLKAIGLDRDHSMVSFFKSLSEADRKDWLRRVGVWADNLHETTARFGDMEVWNRASRFLNGTTYKASGMRALDRAQTGVIAEAVMGSLGKHSHETARISDLPDAMKRFAKSHGFTQDHWDVLRLAELDRGAEGNRTNVTPEAIYQIPDSLEALRTMARRRIEARAGKGAKLSREETDNALADEIQRIKDETVTQLLGAFHEVAHAAGRGFAHSSLYEQDRLGLLSHDAGTPLGEAVRMLWMIRQVPMGLMQTHLLDVPRGMDGWAPRTQYIARYALTQMLATGVAVQLRHLLAGEDPEDMASWGFIGKMAAGGFMGPLLAALIFGSQGERASGILGDALGPAGDALTDAYSLAMAGRDAPGNDRFKGDKYASRVLSFARSNLVPFMNFWYTKAAFNHLVYQQLQEAVDPEYNERVRQRMRERQRAQWWENGALAPQRAPDLGAAVGQPMQQ